MVTIMSALEISAPVQAPATNTVKAQTIKDAVMPSIREAAENASASQSAAVDQMVISAAQVKDALETINQSMRQIPTSLAFTIDSASKRVVVQVTDQDSGEVLLTFPGEATLRVAAHINKHLDSLKGVLFDDKS